VVGEVTTLEHEVGDDAVKGAAGVAVALLASAESTEVLSGLGDNIGKELEVDAAERRCEIFLSAVPMGKKKEGRKHTAVGRDVEVDLGVRHCDWIRYLFTNCDDVGKRREAGARENKAGAQVEEGSALLLDSGSSKTGTTQSTLS
jgi:hypothetical protein